MLVFDIHRLAIRKLRDVAAYCDTIQKQYRTGSRRSDGTTRDQGPARPYLCRVHPGSPANSRRGRTSGRSRHQKGTAMSEFHLALGRPRAPTDPPRSFGRPLWSCHSRPSPQRQPLRRRSLTSRRRLSCVERGVRTQRLERWPTNRAGDREVRKVEVPAFGPKLTGGVSGGWAVRQPPQTADFPGRRS